MENENCSDWGVSPRRQWKLTGETSRVDVARLRDEIPSRQSKRHRIAKILPGDFYFDGGLMIFTAAFHLGYSLAFVSILKKECPR
jgi:hypothetical protein